MGQVPQQLVNGLTLGSVYALTALGYSLVYGMLEMLNFAHGEVLMVGGFVGWAVLVWLRATDATVLFPALAGAMVVAGLLGLAIERYAYRPARGGSRLSPLLSALGASILLQNAVLLLLGARARPYPVLFGAGWRGPGGVNLSPTGVLIMTVSAILVVLLDLLARKTALGRAIRATAQDREAAAMVGIDTVRVVAATFAIGSMLAGAGGVLVGLFYTQIDYGMGFVAGLKAFTAAVLGGIGNYRGAALGGLLLGVAESLAVAFVSTSYRDAVTFVVLWAVLLARPHGLLGESVPERG